MHIAPVLHFSNTFFFLQRKVQAIKDKRAAKEEKERYELLAAKMHAKRVDRLRRREKRNKMLKS
jgi:rRNA-processing protein CGR1